MPEAASLGIVDNNHYSPKFESFHTLMRIKRGLSAQRSIASTPVS
jgi:hypothetical protein